MTSLAHDRSGHWIIATDTHTHQHSKHEDPDHFQGRRGDAVGQTDDQYRADDTDDEFFAIHEFASESIAKIAEQQLSEDVTNVRACIDQPAKTRRVMGLFVRVSKATPISIKWIDG